MRIREGEWLLPVAMGRERPHIYIYINEWNGSFEINQKFVICKFMLYSWSGSSLSSFITDWISLNITDFPSS